MMDAPDGAASGASMRGYRVIGQVHGVGFREWTRRTAERIGLVGSVRNRPDGSVEVQAAGSEDALGELEVMLENGPPLARVERVERLTPEPTMPTTGFRVLH
jgi:acylphosphatase